MSMGRFVFAKFGVSFLIVEDVLSGNNLFRCMDFGGAKNDFLIFWHLNLVKLYQKLYSKMSSFMSHNKQFFHIKTLEPIE
jgi:hypothetical protein